MLTIIGGIIGIITFAGGFLLAIYKIMNRFGNLEESNKCRKQENVILINAVFAICDGLTQIGANGPVTKMKDSLQEYIVKRGD